jgi:hypothetical protein
MTLELTKNNYLYGTGSGETWHVNIDPPKKQVRTYFEETLTALEYVHANKVGKFHLLYSGGLDSEYVARCLLHLKMNFNIVIIRLKNNIDGSYYNDHDTVYAFDFCKNNNINPIIYELDFNKFVDSGKIVEIATSVECCVSAIPGTLQVANQIDGFTLMGNDPPYLRYDQTRDKWYLEELQYIHSILRFYKKNNLNGCPFILSYTAEMMLAFLLDPKIVELGNNRLSGRRGSNSSKSHVFNRESNFNMEHYNFTVGNRVKFTGYENVYREEISNHPNLKIFDEEFWKKWNGEYLEYYPDAVKRLSEFQ